MSLVTPVKSRILGEDNTRYRAMLYYLRKRENLIEIHFVIIKDLEAHVRLVQHKYTARGATIGPDLAVEFESECISLELPHEGVMLGSGWRIYPLFLPVITKEAVDSFSPGQVFPSCQLIAEWTKESKPMRLTHKVTLVGAKEPSNYFTIVLDTGPTPPGLHSKYPAGLDSQPKLSDLMNEVAAKIPSKWRDVGLQLGLDQGVLEGIASISPGDTNLYYINVFTRWKNQSSTTHPHTWSTLVQALESPAVGERRLADKIKSELCSHPFTTAGGVKATDFQLEKLLEKYRHQKKIKHKSLKCLFTGPPRTGKSTLKKRLLKIIKNLKSSGMTSPSGGFENPISAVTGETKERNTALLESDIDWQVQHDVLDEAQIVLEFIDQQPTTNVVHPSPYPAQTAPVLPTPYPPPPGSDPPTRVQSWCNWLKSIFTWYPDPPILDPSHSNQPREAEADTFEDAKHLMQEVLESKGLHSIEKIEKTTTLYLMDTGGQPEFHEIMPVVLNGPALHLVFFNLTFNLNKPVFIRFCKQDGTDAVITYTSSYTGKQMIYQLLSSLYCLSKDLSPDSTSVAVLFGTHLDQLKDQKRQGKKKIEEIDGSLKQLLSNAEFHDQGFLTYPKKGEESTIFIPVNNYSGDEEDLQQLQAFLKQVIDDRFDPVELPSSWLFFHLILRHRYENLGVCKLEECRALAKGCGLDEEDVPKVLRYIHQHLGTILFYEEVQGLNELVICDPNVLFKSIYHLVAVSFAGERAYHTSAAEIRKTGEIPISELQKHIDAQPSSSLLTNDHVVKLLKHFKILTELRDGVFFMPCLLQPDHSLELTTDQLLSLFAPPLLVRFDGNYIPVGVFSALVVKLTQSSWKPDREFRYRNHVSFLNDDGLSPVELIIYPDYLEFRIPIDNHTEEEPEEIHQFCMEVRKTVVDTLTSILVLHNHTKEVKFQLGFYCPGSFQVDSQPHFGGCLLPSNHTNPRNFLCSKSPRCQKQCHLPDQCTIWFPSWKDKKKFSKTTRGSSRGSEMPNPVNTTSRTASEEPFGTPSPKRRKTSSGELNHDQPQNIQYENVDDTPLDEHSVRIVLNSISTIAADWFILGSALGVPPGTLKTIEHDHRTAKRCQTEMITAWLQNSSQPSWQRLASALSSPLVNRIEIATMIAAEHPKIDS